MLGYKWLLLVMLQSVYSQTTKDPDEDKPYKFGFNIQGYQHRQEEKDERGIIKGEYGFITADGYYRVTVYATDENGDFRIISMKNYYVGFPPEDPTTTPGPPSQKNTGNAKPFSGSSGTFGGQQPGSPGTTFSNDKKAQQPVTPRPQGRPACSDCFIPTTTVRTNQGVFGSDRTGGGGGGGAFGGGLTSGGGFGQGPAGGRVGQFPQSAPGSNQRGPTGGQLTQGSPGVGKPDGGRGSPFSSGAPGANAQGSPGFGSRGGISPSSSPFGGVNQNSNSPGFGSGGGGSGGFGGSGGSGGSGFPRGPNNFQNNQLDNGPRQRPKIGEVRDGLPPGVTLNDIKSLLYTFNYTVGFHGHHEDGYRNGDKEGDYFFDGRDGVERKVEYLANEFGYQPNITFIDLPENDIRRPKEETEKEYGLKGYEFKWFYRK